MGRRRKRRKGGMRARTSSRRSSGSPAQTRAPNGTSAACRSDAAPAPAASEEEGDLGKAGEAAALSSSSPRGLVLRIALGGRDGLVGRGGGGGSVHRWRQQRPSHGSGRGFEGIEIWGDLKTSASADPPPPPPPASGSRAAVSPDPAAPLPSGYARRPPPPGGLPSPTSTSAPSTSWYAASPSPSARKTQPSAARATPPPPPPPRPLASLACLLLHSRAETLAAAGGGMSGAAVQAVEPRQAAPAAAAASPSTTTTTGTPTTSQAAAVARGVAGGGGCAPARAAAAVTMEHVLLALRETEAEREARIRGVFAFFDAAGRGSLDHAQIAAGLAALRVPDADPEEARGGGAGAGAGAEDDYARALLRACGRDRDGRVGYDDFRRYMDHKELELYRIFQAIDVEHNGCILPEELWHALVKAGIEIDDEELARFVEHVDKDNDGIITFEEWRDFLLLYPHEATIENIYHHWERVCLVDIGEQAAIPEGISKHVSASKYLIAGGIAGAASRTATAPLDRLKVIMQVQTVRTTVAHAVKNIWREGGLLGFFRGNGLNVVKVAPESAIRFYAYEMLKEYIMKNKGENKSDIGTSGRLMAGGMAGAIAQTAIYPIDLVKTRLQTFEGGRIPSLGALSRDIWIHEGPRAFYRGLVPSLLGMVPYAGIDLTVYETLKEMSKTYVLKDSDPGPLVQLGCGTVSGALGATCVYPLQVIRTRLQAQAANSDAAYRGMTDVFWRTLQREGISGFYKGLVPNLLKVVPAASITYLVYETMKKRLSLE